MYGSGFRGQKCNNDLIRNKDLGPNELKLNIFACTSSLTLRVW